MSICLALISCRALIAQQEENWAATFENSIRPVLSGTCFACHGDANARLAGGLRVDSREALLSGGDSGPAIDLQHPTDSLLLKAIARAEGVSPMPPDNDRALRADQVNAFRKWIAAGAPWPEKTSKFTSQQHWAFQPLAPCDRALDIDHWIRSRQVTANVSMAPLADKRTLARRATFDLTGLPPTDEQVREFESDPSPDAYARLIDRLLESPGYGEHWGRHWLDIVRYADTAGETADYPVPNAWRYRNYVIESFQRDKPYDQFLREQIAGDILAEESDSAQEYASRVTATGYLALSRRFGFDSENYHHLTIQDTIDTLGQSLLGLSLGCARCHDHKFDPISMQDYYGLYGIFDSSRYAFPGSEQKQKVRSMMPLVPTREAQARWHSFEQRTGALRQKLERSGKPAAPAVLRMLSAMDGDFELQAPAAGGTNGVLVPPWLAEGPVAVAGSAQSPFRNVYGPGKSGIRIEANEKEKIRYRVSQAIYPQRMAARTATLFFSIDFRVAASNESATGLHQLILGGYPHSPAVIIDIGRNQLSWPCTASNNSSNRILFEPGQWNHLQVVLNLAQRTFTAAISQSNVNSSNDIRTGDNSSERSDTTERSGTAAMCSDWNGAIDLFVLQSSADIASGPRPTIELDNVSITDVAIPDASRPQESADSASPDSAPSDTANAYADALQRELTNGPFEMAYAVAEGTPHNVAIQLRGEPSQPGEVVPRGFIKVLGGTALPMETPGSGRLPLANWLTRDVAHLTARVMANRIWQFHFGRGLVPTPNDFGVRGQPPTHPELLDQLAGELIRSGWSVKAMHRQIMLSETYQQASTWNGSQELSHLSRDLYVGFTRRRLSAEEIRDSILHVSGLLDATPGAAHPFPAPTTWGFTQHAPFSAVYDHDKRSVYLMTQRLKRHPFLALFDGADPNTSTAVRLDTTVPTQALYFMNDPFVHRASLALATRLMKSTSADRCLHRAFEVLLEREPTASELQLAKEFIAAYQAELVDAKIPPSQMELDLLAAWLRVIMGSNEFVHVD